MGGGAGRCSAPLPTLPVTVRCPGPIRYYGGGAPAWHGLRVQAVRAGLRPRPVRQQQQPAP
jgi:hypothetical protein